jgi:tetratricopeptide (TPR) repeat protein
MRFYLLVGLALGGCSWSNSLYQARRLSNAAERAERQDRSFDAGSFWAQAAVKADSAASRDPDNGEALWLKGRALARTGECGAATPALERARILAPAAKWQQAVTLELGRCQILTGDYEQAFAVLTPLLATVDEDLRLELRLLLGRTSIATGRWQAGLDQLAGIDLPGARVERAVALAALDRTDEAVAELAPALESQDIAANWDRLLRLIAAEDQGDADRLLGQLRTFPGVGDTLSTSWELAVAEGVGEGDPIEGVRRLQAMTALPKTPSTSRAKVLLAERRITLLTRGDSLAELLGDLDMMMEGDAVLSLVIGPWYTRVQNLAEDLDTLPPGTPGGDLAMFYQAERALSELQSPSLAAWLYLQLEIGWPTSPYVPKAMLARMRLQPDSVESIRARLLSSYPDSPYLRWFNGTEGRDFVVLDSLLGSYIGDRAAVAALRRTTNVAPPIQE